MFFHVVCSEDFGFELGCKVSDGFLFSAMRHHIDKQPPPPS